jgi:hypothetical protein
MRLIGWEATRGSTSWNEAKGPTPPARRKPRSSAEPGRVRLGLDGILEAVASQYGDHDRIGDWNSRVGLYVPGILKHKGGGENVSF